MAYQNVSMLQGAQAAVETTRGTAVVPNRWLYPAGGGVSVTYNQSADDYTESTRSYHGKKRHALGLYSVDLTVEERASYESLVFWLNAALAGGVDTGVAAGDAYDYAFTPDGEADDLAFFTMRAGDPAAVYEFAGCAVNELTLRFDPASEATMMLSANIMANSLVEGVAFETGITEGTRELVLSRGTKIYIDTDPDDLGDTQLLGEVRSGSLTIQNNWERKAFLENTEAYSADMARGEQMFTGEFVFEFLDDDQFAAMRSGTNRAIRIEQTGPAIDGDFYKLVIDIPNAFYNAPSIGFSGQNKTLTFGFVAYSTPDYPAPLEATVTIADATVAL